MRRRDFNAQWMALAGAAPLAAALQGSKLDQAAGLFARQADAGKLRAASMYVRQGSLTFERSFGEAKSSGAIFLIASITKPMTATAVMLLADRAKLALEDPVHKFIPEFGEGDRKLITIQHLLTHTSGLPDQLPDNDDLRKRHAPLKDFVAGALRVPLLFKPGAQYKYQSMGILLAAEICERITKQPLPQFLDREVFQPLGMTRTALGLGKFKIADTMLSQVEHSAPEAGGSAASTSDWNWNSPYWRGLGAPWGGAHSTGPDIAKFLESFLRPDGRVLKKETAAAMITDHNQGLNEPRGLGFALKPGSFGTKCSTRTFGHGGSTGTLAWADPASGVTCILLTTLPARVSDKLLLKPASDLISEAV